MIGGARLAHPMNKFIQGSFTDIANEDISFLIAVNFLHSIDGNTVIELLAGVTKRNSVDYIVVDQLKSPAYRYIHDWEKVMGELGYTLYKKSRRYEAARGSRWNLIYRQITR